MTITEGFSAPLANLYKKQVMTVQYGSEKKGSINPNTGELASGPETLSDKELARTGRFGAAIKAHPMDDPVPYRRSPIWSKDHGSLLSSPIGEVRGSSPGEI